MQTHHSSSTAGSVSGTPAAAIVFPRTDAVLRTLDNGLEIVTKEDHSAPVVSVQAWVRTGSCLEEDLLGSGVSHLLEHMVFKGSASRGPAELARAVQAFGGYLNAYTSFDRTVYYIDAPAEGFETALDVLVDLVNRSIFPPEEFEKEKDVIRREIDMGEDDPDTKNSEMLFSTIWRVHPMGQPIIGHLDLFNRITREQMIAYYGQHYVPNNMFFVVVGPIDADTVEEKVRERLGHVPRAHHAPVHLPEEPAQLGRREAHIEFPTELSKLTLAWRIPGLTHPDVPALEVLAELLGQGRSSRLFRSVREGKKLVHGIGSSCYTPAAGGIFSIYADLDFERRDEACREILELIASIQRDGVSDAEIAKAQRMVLGEQLESLTTMKGLASDLGSNWHVARNLDFTREMIEAIERVTAADVQAVARQYLVERSLTVTSLNPEDSLTKAAAANRVSQTGPIEKIVLANGITLLVKPDHRVPLVTLHACLRGGVLAETEATSGLTRLMSRCLLKGTKSRTSEEIVTVLEEAGGGISSESGGSTWAVTVDALKPDLALGLDILADVLLNPTFPEAEVARERDVQLASIKAEADRLTSVAFRELRRELFGPNPLALDRNGTPESLNTLTPETLREFHRAHAVTGNLILAVFGDVDAASIQKLVEERFAAMPQGPRRESPVGLGHMPGLTTVTREITKPKKQAVLAIGFPTVELHHPDRLALDLLDEACSDMASRLFLRIREEHGLAYYTGAFQILGMAPGAFAFYLGTAPEQLDKAQAELLDEIAVLARHGLEEEEFERVKASWIGKHLIQYQNPESLARMTSLDELYGAGHNFHEQLTAKVRAMTVSEIKAVAARYFGPGAPHVIVRVQNAGG